MKKILSFVTSVVLVATMLPLTLVQFDMVPKASAALCTISADTDMTAAYVATCDGITVDTSSTLTFHGENLDMNGSNAFTVNESVTVTWSGTGVFTDANDSIAINGNLTHLASGSGVILSASGNVSVGSNGTINANAKGCSGGVAIDEDGYGPDADNVCTSATAGYGIGHASGNGGGAAGHGGAGGRGQQASTGGTTYGDSLTPTLIGSGGAAGAGADGGDGGGRIWLDVSGELAVGGVISANGGNGASAGFDSAGGGSGGSIYISTGTLSGASSITVTGGDYGGATYGGGGGGGGRIAVYYDTSGGFNLDNITSAGGITNGNYSSVAGSPGTTFILDQTQDNLRLNSGFDFPASGDYTKANITISSGTIMTCEATDTFDIGATSNFTDEGSTWNCSNTIATMNLTAGTLALTGVDWNITDTADFNLSVATWTNSSASAIDVSKAGALVDWNVTNNLTLNDLTWNGASNSGTSSALGGVITFDNAIDVVFNNTDINSSIDWDLTNLTLDYLSSINSVGRGCTGGTDNDESGDGPDEGTGICATGTTGYGIGHISGSGGAGAGHGGAGGRGQQAATGGTTYGNSSAPTLFGSGGAAGANGDGGDGGGKVILDLTATLTNNGSIGSNGATGVANAGGGGSGGSVYLTVVTLSGTGSISANGGNGFDQTYDGGGGGGGRVAVLYDTISGFDLSLITATAGTSGGGYSAQGGTVGTTFLADQTNDDLRVTTGLEFQSGGDYDRRNITVDSGALLSCNAITTLNIGASGTYTDNGSTWNCNGAITTMNLSSSGAVALTGVDWNITNTDSFNLVADTWTTSGTNTIDVSKAGAAVDWDITNALTLNNLTWVGAANAGIASALGGVITFNNAIDVVLNNTDINSSIDWDLPNLTLDYLSSINADGRGCTGGTDNDESGDGPDASTGICATGTTGYGIGHISGNGGAGAGHGGAGGRGQQASTGGATYGSNTAPILFGSGGAAGANGDGGDGGGKVILDLTSTLTNNGVISADGAGGVANAGGGGSGGSVYLTVVTLSGTGSISANGGNGFDQTYDGGGGGGGRVSILYGTDSSSFLGSMTASNSTVAGTSGGGYSAAPGSIGTLYSLASVFLDSATITDTSGYTNDSTPVITLVKSGATPTHVALSCNGGSNWSDWIVIPDDDVLNDVDGPAFDITSGATGCTATEESKTITVKLKNGDGESSTKNDTTIYDITAPTVDNVTASNANATYGVDDVITVQVIFSEEVTKAGTPQIELDFDGTDRTVDSTTLATATLSFPYTIVSGDNTSDLAYTGTGALTLNGGAIGDLAGNTADLELAVPGLANSISNNKAIVVSTNQDPTVTGGSVSASQETDGSSEITIEFEMDDPDDDDTLQAKIEYNVGNGWSDPEIFDDSEDIEATYGEPEVDNDQTYQVGQSGAYITSSSGANTVTIKWDSASDESDIDISTAQVRITPYDSIAAGTTVTSSNFTIDQVAPSGGFTETYTTAINETNVSIGWDPVTSETNFSQYTIYYKRSSVNTYSSAGTLSTMSTSASTISGLTAGVQYDVYVQASDSYGNTTNSPVLTFTTSQEGEGTTSGNTVSQAGGGSSSSNSPANDSDTADTTSDDTTEDTGDSDQQAGEGETGEEDYSDIDEPTDEPSDGTEESPSDSEEEAPTEEPIEPPVEETEPEDYISEPLHESPEESPSDTEDEEPLLVGVFDDGEVLQEVYEDEIVITLTETDKTITVEITTEEIEEQITEEVIESDKDLKQIFKDKDDDGIPDIWEEKNLNDIDFDGTADTDGDGLTDAEEYFSGSDPLDADTDNDGLSDIVEISLNLDPNSWDTDGDGVSDDTEIFNNQDPTTPEKKDIDPVLHDEQNDTDGDGLSDYMEEYYNTDPYSSDTDGDGIDDTQELFLDTNPTETDYIEELDTKITNLKGTTSTSSNVLIRGTAQQNPTIYIVNDKDEIVSIIEAEIDEEGKFAITNGQDLPDGEYRLLITTEDDFSTETLSIDKTQQTEQPQLDETPEEITEQPQLTGITEPNAIIYATWKSLILSSVIVADSQTGEFALEPPSELPEGEHTVYVYTQDQETNTTSETLQVDFTITQSNVLHESAAQREAQDKGFPYMTLILLALIAAGGAFVLFRKGKSQHAEERDLLKKL